MRQSFSARQTTTVSLPGTLAQVREFLQEPQHLIDALLDRDRVLRSGTDRFSVRMRAIHALGVSIQPIVELRIATFADARLQLEAIGCRVEGNDWIDRHFDLDFVGSLAPLSPADSIDRVTLAGDASLQVHIGLPPLLRLTPQPVVMVTGNTITRGVLTAMQRSLAQHLPVSFHRWQQLSDRPSSHAAAVATVLSAPESHP
jgi:hypothetical protein